MVINDKPAQSLKEARDLKWKQVMEYFSHNPKILLDALYDPAEEQEAMYHPVYDEIIDRENIHRARATASNSHLAEGGSAFRWQAGDMQDGRNVQTNLSQAKIEQDVQFRDM